MHTNSMIDFSSSNSKTGTLALLLLMSKNSWMTPILHVSSSLSCLYLIERASMAVSWSTFDQLVRNKMFLRLLPVTDLQSYLMTFNKCFSFFFLQFLILSMNAKNLFMSKDLKWMVSLKWALWDSDELSLVGQTCSW